MDQRLEKYLNEAADCDAHAASAKDAVAAETFRKAAQVWRDLAIEWAALRRVRLVQEHTEVPEARN